MTHKDYTMGVHTGANSDKGSEATRSLKTKRRQTMEEHKMTGPGRFVAFVRDTGDYGPVLYASGSFVEEFRMGGYDVESLDMPVPSERGLLLFEGWVEIGPGPDPDVVAVGEWRRLTHWEICRIRHGVSPFL